MKRGDARAPRENLQLEELEWSLNVIQRECFEIGLHKLNEFRVALASLVSNGGNL